MGISMWSQKEQGHVDAHANHDRYKPASFEVVGGDMFLEKPNLRQSQHKEPKAIHNERHQHCIGRHWQGVRQEEPARKKAPSDVGLITPLELVPVQPHENAAQKRTQERQR